MSVSERLEHGIARYRRVLVLVLVVVAVASFAGAGFVYATPPVEEVTERTNRQQVSTDGRTSAVVTGNATLYAANERLVDMPAYFFAASPNLTVGVETAVPADQEVEVSHRLVLRMRGTRDGREFWRSQRVLSAERASVSDGSFRTNATLNMSRLRVEMNERRALVGSVGTFSTEFVLNVSYETDSYSGTLSASTPVVMAETAYWTDADLSAGRTHSTPVTERVRRPPDLRVVGALVGLGLACLAGAGVVVVRYRNVDPRVSETTVARSRFDEWISNGEIPTKSGKEYTSTDSLEDLVDIAIDSGKRVIYDDELDAYAVIEGDIVYYFTTGEDDVTDWFDV